MNAHDDDRDAGTPLAGLPRELAPPPALEQRVVARLAARGLLARRAVRRWLVPLAAALAGLAGGWLLRGSPAPPAAGSDAPLYLLLLSAAPQTDLSETELVRIYSAWGREQAALGRMAGARKLEDEGIVLAAGGDGPAATLRHDEMTPTGFFLVRARSLAEAEAIARTCPHLRYGGRVTVRPIDPV
jgi:hypothetical protein